MRKKKRFQSTAGKRSGWHVVLVVCAAPLFAGTALTGCSNNLIKHGQHFRPADLQQIQPGQSKDQVKLALGTPSTQSASGAGEAYYYISSTSSQAAFLKPKEINRQIVAVYFNEVGSVDRVANYGLKDGKVFDYLTRTTPAPGASDEGLIQQLFRNLGQNKQIFDPNKY